LGAGESRSYKAWVIWIIKVEKQLFEELLLGAGNSVDFTCG
jgi:hypothetical protein